MIDGFLPEGMYGEMIQHIPDTYYLKVFDRRPAVRDILLTVLTQVIFLVNRSFLIL